MEAFNPADQAINSSNFVRAAKMIQYSNIQPSLLQTVVKNQLERKRMQYAYPASIGNAKIHRDASKFGFNQSIRGQPPRLCPCCLERVETASIEICYSTSNVEIEEEMGYSQYKLKTGIALFFSFIKMAIVYFLFRFLILDGFNLLTNVIQGNYCQTENQSQCYNIFWNQISSLNKKNNEKFILIQDILGLVLVVFSIIFFFIYRKRQYSKAKLLNSMNQSEEEYTILVEDIPLIDFPPKSEAKKMKAHEGQIIQLYHRQHLWNYFQSKIKNWVDKRGTWVSGSNELDFLEMLKENNNQFRSKDIVKSISMCYNLQRLQTLQKERSELIFNKKKYQTIRKQIEQQSDDRSLGVMDNQADRFSSVPNQVSFLNDCQIILSKQYANDNSVLFNITNFTGKALISFQYQHYQQYILEEADRDPNFLIFNGSKLKISHISNPRNILWNNFRHSREKQTKKLFATLYILIFLVVLCFFILCCLEFGKISSQFIIANKDTSLIGKYIPYIFVGVQILTIIVTNHIIVLVSRKRTKQQCSYTRSEQSLSIILKVVSFQFICTCILPFLVSRIFEKQIGGKLGLTFQISVLGAFYGLIINILSIIFPKAIGRSLRLMCKYRGFTDEDQVQKFQSQLNKQFQYVPFDIINQYSNYILFTFLVCFYASLVPALTPFTIIVFSLQYWIDKINLFKRCSHPRSFSFYLSRNILKIFEVNVFIFALGNLLFGFYTHKSFVNILNIAAVGIASLYICFLIAAPIKYERKLFGNYQSSQRALYDECVSTGKFEETFWTQNPATYLVKESEVTGKQTVVNPGLNRIFVKYEGS